MYNKWKAKAEKQVLRLMWAVFLLLHGVSLSTEPDKNCPLMEQLIIQNQDLKEWKDYEIVGLEKDDNHDMLTKS
jgi:hypothetical protein